MVIREAKAKDWPAIWLILNEIGTAGETLTWDSTRTEARARTDMRRSVRPGEPGAAAAVRGAVSQSGEKWKRVDRAPRLSLVPKA
jgi:hypothetical protein